eukprot:6150036-Pleurochrysis_carterae.AAC.2
MVTSMLLFASLGCAAALGISANAIMGMRPGVALTRSAITPCTSRLCRAVQPQLCATQAAVEAATDISSSCVSPSFLSESEEQRATAAGKLRELLNKDVSSSADGNSSGGADVARVRADVRPGLGVCLVADSEVEAETELLRVPASMHISLANARASAFAPVLGEARAPTLLAHAHACLPCTA